MSRGIPLVGSGPSAIPGTQPLQALLQKEREAGGNLFKSDSGWRRFQIATDKGAHARRAHMDATPNLSNPNRSRKRKRR